MGLVFLLLSTSFLLPGACTWHAGGATGCEPTGPAHALPAILEESSGVAWSPTHPDVLWSHNDGGHEAALYALDLQGRLLGAFPLRGVRNRDWEDVATGPCGAGHCIYVADTGDNAEVRPQVSLLRVQEPTALEDGVSLEPEVFPMVLPDGPRDVEALFVLPGERIHLITKGRNHAITVYRYPPPLRPGEVVTLEEVQTLTEGSMAIPSQVTGADADPCGAGVAVRTYETLTFYAVEGGRLVPLEGAEVNLRTLEEPQGEGVALAPEGQVALTTEGGNFGGKAALRTLSCRPSGS